MIGKKIKEYRVYLKLTGATLANLAGINQPYLSQIENEKKVPPFDTFMSLVNVISQNAPISPENAREILTEDNFQLFKEQFKVSNQGEQKEKAFTYLEDGDYEFDYTGHKETGYTIIPTVGNYSTPIAYFRVRDNENFEIKLEETLRKFYHLPNSDQYEYDNLLSPNLVDFEINGSSADLIYYIPQIREALFKWWYNHILQDFISSVDFELDATLANIPIENSVISDLSQGEVDIINSLFSIRNTDGTFTPLDDEDSINLSKELLEGRVITFDLLTYSYKNVRLLYEGQLLSNSEMAMLKVALDAIKYNRQKK